MIDGMDGARNAQPVVGVIMGSRSDLPTMESAFMLLEELEIPYEKKVVSAHRTPDRMFEYAETAEERGLEVIIAGAGKAAHLPGMTASKTLLPVIGVPVKTSSLSSMDSLFSIVQMPGGIPVATMSIGKHGAKNAALMAAEILSIKYPELRERLRNWRHAVRDAVLEEAELDE